MKSKAISKFHGEDPAFAKRLLMAFNAVGSIYKLAQLTSISESALSHYIKRGGEPTRRMLVQISEATGYRLEWLATGNGPQKTADKHLEQTRMLCRVEEQAWIPFYHAKSGDSTPTGRRLLPSEDVLPFPKAFLADISHSPEENLRVLRHLGDAMLPTFSPTEIVLVDTTLQTLGDGIFAFANSDEAAIQRVQLMGNERVRISYDNPAYASREILKLDLLRDTPLIGRVVMSSFKRF